MKPIYLIAILLVPSLFSFGYLMGRRSEAMNHKAYIETLNLGGK